MQITNKTYIFIIDSGGAAAVCVLATSLSENPENGVLLLEVIQAIVYKGEIRFKDWDNRERRIPD